MSMETLFPPSQDGCKPGFGWGLRRPVCLGVRNTSAWRLWLWHKVLASTFNISSPFASPLPPQKITTEQNVAAWWAAFTLKLPNQKTTSEKQGWSSLQSTSESRVRLADFTAPSPSPRPLSTETGRTSPTEAKLLGERVFPLLFPPTLPYPTLACSIATHSWLLKCRWNHCDFEGTTICKTDRFELPCNAGQLDLAKNLFQASLVLCPGSSCDQILQRVYSSCWLIFIAIYSVPHERHSSSIPLTSRKQMAFSLGTWSWKYREYKLFSYSCLTFGFMLSIDVPKKATGALLLEVSVTLPAILNHSSAPPPPLTDSLEL